MTRTKLLFLIPLFTVFSINLFGQITTTAVAPKTEPINTAAYDSTLNFLGEDVYKYKGQELYLIGKSEERREYGYDDFVINYRKDAMGKNIYKCCDGYNSKYDELAEKYFTVLDVIKHPESEEFSFYDDYYFLKLQEKQSNDIVYFQYITKFEHSFPFIVVGFFEKQKKLVIGQEFVIKDYYLGGSTDIYTGKELTINTGQIWKTIDFTIEQKYYTLSLVIENPLGEITTMSYESTFGEYRPGAVYTLSEAENYYSLFGQETFDKILQKKVSLGMTKLMCELSWGKPEKINETITSGQVSEQWVYSDNYLYFENGILTTIQ
ncbi:MAG: hypothetical protein VXZ76_02955 [Bacteroidota bacterium]|nr:hypothetical protein [Bacteroidota bacterium]